MKNYSIIGTCQIYNELRKGNLERFAKYFRPLVDLLIVYDDGSTDGSYEFMLQYTPYIIRGNRNEFVNERSHKQSLLTEALVHNPDFIMYLDADEVLSNNAAWRLQELCEYATQNQVDGLSFQKYNLWRSHSWRRTDSLFNDGWFVHLWRVTPGMTYHDVKPGLHQPPYPSTVENIEQIDDVKVIHYGFSSERQIAYKYLVYHSHGQRGYVMLDRLIDETQLTLEKVPAELFPEGLYIDESAPQAMPIDQALAYVERYRNEVFPK